MRDQPQGDLRGLKAVVGILGVLIVIVAFAALILFALTPMLRLPLSGIRDGLTDGSRGSAGSPCL